MIMCTMMTDGGFTPLAWCLRFQLVGTYTQWLVMVFTLKDTRDTDTLGKQVRDTSQCGRNDATKLSASLYLACNSAVAIAVAGFT